jgi:hypothetical protein
MTSSKFYHNMKIYLSSECGMYCALPCDYTLPTNSDDRDVVAASRRTAELDACK